MLHYTFIDWVKTTIKRSITVAAYSGLSQTHSVCIADLLDVPLLIPSEREKGNGSVGAATGQDQTKVIGTPADRVHCGDLQTKYQDIQTHWVLWLEPKYNLLYLMWQRIDYTWWRHKCEVDRQEQVNVISHGHTESYRPDDSCPVYSYILSQAPFSSFQMMTLRS